MAAFTREEHAYNTEKNSSHRVRRDFLSGYERVSALNELFSLKINWLAVYSRALSHITLRSCPPIKEHNAHRELLVLARSLFNSQMEKHLA